MPLPAVDKALHFFARVFIASFAALDELDNTARTIDDPPAQLPRPQAQIEIFAPVEIFLVKTLQFNKKIPAHQHAGPGHHIKIAHRIDARIVSINFAVDILGHTVYQLDAGVLNLARFWIE